jgi:histidine phosphatase superfamily protein (branch 1)
MVLYYKHYWEYNSLFLRLSSLCWTYLLSSKPRQRISSSTKVYNLLPRWTCKNKQYERLLRKSFFSSEFANSICYYREMKIYLARHGKTNYNDLDLCNSDPSVDVHITSEGTKQAQALANKLKTVSLDRIFVSELRRTKQTAEIVNQFHGIEIDVEPLLNDHRSGYYYSNGCRRE